MMGRYAHHKYTWEKPFGTVRHMWSLVGPRGGVHFTFNEDEKYSSANIEFHYRLTENYKPNDPPDHINCWLIGGPCHHDGSGLYAQEKLLPMILPLLRKSNHEKIFKILEIEANWRFRKDEHE